MERFFSKTVKSESGCLEWTAAKKDGYGVFNYDGRHTMLAHRWAYILANGGKLTAKDVIMHRCDNPSCVNHEHLQKGTHADNHDDKKRKGRSNTGMRHGHSKLTDAQVLEIRSSTLRQRDLAAQYGVTQSVISEVRSGKAWRHI